MSIFSIFKKNAPTAHKLSKESDFIIWNTAKGNVELNGKVAHDFLIEEAKSDKFYRVDVLAVPMVDFLHDIFFKYRKELLERQLLGLLTSLSLKPSSAINTEFFNIFESWDVLLEESDISLEHKFLLIKKLAPALAQEANKIVVDRNQNNTYNIVSAPGFSALCLFIDDVLSVYGYEQAYHDKEFRDNLSMFVDLLSADIYVQGQATRYHQQPTHYLDLKTRNFRKNYSFLSEAGIGRDDGYSQYLGVSYALQSDLYKFSNLVFFKVQDLEKMYIYASNYFASDSLIVTTKVDDSNEHSGQMRIINERKSFIFDYDKIKGHMNFPDVFTSIMKNSYVGALNGVITTQVEYKMRVADSIETQKLNQTSTFVVNEEDPKKEQEIRVDAFLKFLLREFDYNYELEVVKPDFGEMKNSILKGEIPENNTWVKSFQEVATGESKKLSNLLRYLVFIYPEDKVVRVLVSLFLANIRYFDSDLMVFESVTFDVRKSRERVLKHMVEFNKEWADNPEKYTFEYLDYDIKNNKVFKEDDFICSFVMDSLFRKWSMYKDEKREEDAYQVAIMIKDFYTLVILNSSTEYENDFWEKYSVAVDRIYQEYVYEDDTGGTETVLVSNLDLQMFWSNKENKKISIKQMWTALERMKNSEPLFKEVFKNKDFFIKYDTYLRRGPALNNNFTVLMEHDATMENLFNRLMPKWFKHCLYSDELTLEKMMEVIESGRKATVTTK